MENLTILYLHDNAVTDVGTSLQGLKSLVLLDISGNHLKTVRVCVFSSDLKTCGCLIHSCS